MGSNTDDGEVDHEHYLFLAKRWGNKAEENVEKWGVQPPEIVLLALIEELGEVADELIEETPGPHPDNTNDRPFDGYKLLHETRKLGFEVREFLESEYPEPAGDGDHERIDLYPIVGGPVQDVDAVQDELDDLMPLGWQLTWALQEVNGGAE